MKRKLLIRKSAIQNQNFRKYRLHTIRRSSSTKTKRKKRVNKRKNFFPLLFAILISWVSLGYVIYAVDPNTQGVIPLFFVIVFFALTFTFSTLFANSKKGFISGAFLTLFLILRFFGVGNIINFFILFGLAIATNNYTR